MAEETIVPHQATMALQSLPASTTAAAVAAAATATWESVTEAIGTSQGAVNLSSAEESSASWVVGSVGSSSTEALLRTTTVGSGGGGSSGGAGPLGDDYINATTVLPSLISVVLSKLSTLAETAAATLVSHVVSSSTESHHHGATTPTTDDHVTTPTTNFINTTSSSTSVLSNATASILLSDVLNITNDLLFNSVFGGITGGGGGTTGLGGGDGDVTFGTYNYTGPGFTTTTTIAANYSPTMEMNMNGSDIITQDGNAGAQYRLSPADSGINDSLFHNMTNNPNRQRPFDKTCMLYDFIIEAIFMGCFCIFGFTGNTLSMICLWRDRSKTATPFLLVSLELADTLFLFTVFVLRVVTSIHMFTRWFGILEPLFPYIGSYLFAFALIAETGSIYLTVLVTVNRYISVCRPYEASDLCSIYHARRHVVFVAAFSILFNLPRFFEYRVVQVPARGPGNATITRAVLTPFADNKIYKIVYANALYFLVMFLIPLVTLIILNYKLIKALRKTKKKRAQLLSSSVDSQSRSEDDITLVLIVVVIVFIITQTPALITQSLFSFLDMSIRVCPNAFFFYERISDLMVVANASMNFIIYCFCSTKFRQILVNLLCKKGLDSPEQSYDTRVTKVRTTKCGRGAKDSMV